MHLAFWRFSPWFLALWLLALGRVCKKLEGRAQPPKHPVSKCQDTHRRNTGVFGAHLWQVAESSATLKSEFTQLPWGRAPWREQNWCYPGRCLVSRKSLGRGDRHMDSNAVPETSLVV